MRAGSSARIAPEPVEEGADVADAVLAQRRAVVEADEALAEAGRAADIGIEDGDAELVDQIIVAAEEARARLALGPAVDVDDQRPAARESAPRRAGRGSPTRARRRSFAPRSAPARVGIGVEAAGFAARPAGDGERPRIDRIGVGRAASGGEAEADRAPGRDLDAADHAGGKPADQPGAAGARIEQPAGGRSPPRW